MSTRELNRRLRELAADGTEVVILNPEARHNISVGILNRCKIDIQGSVGYFAASMIDGPEVIIDGNSGWALGENMMSGNSCKC